MNRIRILHFSNENARGGAEEHMLMLLRGLDRSHFELLLACTPELRSQFSDLPGDVEYLPLRLRRPWDAGAGLHLARFLRRRRVHLLHAHISCAGRAAAPWARLAGVVTLETPHVREAWRQGWKRLAVFDRVAGRLQCGYVAVSHANARYLTEELRLPASKVRTIPNGIDVDRFTAPLPPALDPRPGLGIAPDELLLVCAARLEPQKGHRVLLDALAKRPADTRARLRLVCLVDGALREALARQCQQLDLGERVIWAGFCPHVERWLAVADIFVLPSWYEGLPLVAMEAAAAGCPVVATAVDGTPEAVAEGRTGLLVPPGDAAALAAALLLLAADPALRRSMGIAGRARAQREFDQARQLATTGDYYMDLVRRAPAAGAAASAAGPRGAA